MKIQEAQVREWLDQVTAGEISFSRMVELINEAGKLMEDKAAKWDALEERIGKFYESDEDDEPEGDLCDIGEIAASAFGYL
ncbi:hypothetical protein [Dyadobacter diqingensis]|uniref:hypothetical protein n=1 Tax=Dyadobacter diqingensis TaxID=2938121 RepID=UPI0020C5544F|nr:hypothetical protein [Dyadobacter diqingensis]